MKVLFITHDAALYGASKSLQPIVRGFADDLVDLMVSLRFIDNVQVSELRDRFGSHLRRIYRYFLPFDRDYKGKDPRRGRSAIVSAAREALWKMQRSRVRRIFHEEQYDVIHLNSLTLHRLVDDAHEFYIHVREIYDGSDDGVYQSLQAARGVIFIDDATRKPFEHLHLRRSMVLNNPVDMTSVDQHRQIAVSGGSVSNKVIFALIGKLSENKGTIFIIETFRMLAAQHAELLIVGNGEGDSLAQCKRAAGGDARVHFLGEEPDIAKVYAAADYILRGEAYPCVGRTVYEGLYAGCEVIVPGNTEAASGFFEIDRFKESIHFYDPRHQQSLLNQLERHADRKVPRKRGLSNVTEYLQQFRTFLASGPL
jgi:glycosyltransferase involved in cell wall biosynthesis